MRPLLLASLLALAALPARAADSIADTPFMPMPPRAVGPDSPLRPDPNGPPPDDAFGAYQRGYFLTALRAATERVSANPKDAAAMTLIGQIYRDGVAVAQNDAEAARWFALGSRLGDANAQFALGVLKLDGARGVTRDRAEAQAQFEKAAAQGHASALYDLGVLAIDVPQDTQPDFAKAAKYFKRAAEAGDGNAAYSYGVQLRQGKGVPLDISGSAHWFKVAADEGIIAGQVEYAIMLFNGIGVIRDETAAAQIFLLAAARRNPIAQNRLAHLYVTGRGVPKDLVRAALWNTLAKRAGDQDDELDKALANLTPDQQKQADALIRAQMEF